MTKSSSGRPRSVSSLASVVSNLAIHSSTSGSILLGAPPPLQEISESQNMDMKEENRAAETSGVRIFVGGLGEGVTDDNLQTLFGSLGSVDGVEIIRTKGRSFAYVDFIPSPTDQKSLSKLFSRYSGCLWKGGKLRLEKAKEHYLVRLKREWAEDAKLVSDEPCTSLDLDKSVSAKEMPSRESLKTKKLRIFFPKLKKVKTIPFSGTGKHKYSFPKVEEPPLPVHFCDCEEHSSPSGTVRGNKCYNGEAESGGMNDEEVDIMNAVMNKLFEREKISSPTEMEQNSLESSGGLESDQYEEDSATTDDDDDGGLIINMETKKKKRAMIGSQELERILENQFRLRESGLNRARILKEEQNKNMPEVQKSNNIAPDKKGKPTLNLELKGDSNVSATPEGKRHIQTLPDEMSSGVQTTELGNGFSASTKVSWSQKSSWRKLLGDGGSGAFNASYILPDVNSSKEQGSDGSCALESANDKAVLSEMDEDLENKPPKTQVIGGIAEAQPSKLNGASKQLGRGDGDDVVFNASHILPDFDSSKEEQESGGFCAPESARNKTEHMEMDGDLENKPTKTQVMEGLAETQPTKINMASKQSGRGAAWLQKQSWTQLVGQNNNSFSISQVVPGITYEKPVAREPIVDLAVSSDCKHNGFAKHTNNEPVDGCNLVKSIPEKNQHVSGNDTTPTPIIEKKCETEAKETSTTDVKIGETCSFMRSAASLKEWEKTKAALSASLKRKRDEKKQH